MDTKSFIHSKYNRFTDWMMLVSIAFLMATIFLYPESTGSIKYISRITLLVSSLLYIVINKTKFCFRYLAWLLTLTILLLINVFFAYNKGVALSTFLLVLQAMWLAFFIFVWLVETKNVKLLFLIIVFLTILYCFRLYKYIGLINWGTRKIAVMLGTNVNAIGMRLAVASCLSLYLFSSYRTKFRFLFIVSFLLFGLFILLTGSRRALLLFIIILSIFAFTKLNGGIKKIVALLITFFILFSIYQITHLNQQLYAIIGSRIDELLSSIVSQEDNLGQADADRLIMLERGIELFFERPLFGWGMGNFKYVSGIAHEYSHNNYIELLSTAGAIVFFVYYFFVFYLLVCCFKIKKKTPERFFTLALVIMVIIADMAAPNYTSLLNHVMLSISYAFFKKSNLVFVKKSFSPKRSFLQLDNI